MLDKTEHAERGGGGDTVMEEEECHAETGCNAIEKDRTDDKMRDEVPNVVDIAIEKADQPHQSSGAGDHKDSRREEETTVERGMADGAFNHLVGDRVLIGILVDTVALVLESFE